MSIVSKRIGLTAAALVLGLVPMKAQGTQTGGISGQAVDTGGKALSGVQVVITAPQLQVQRMIRTDAAGRFHTRLLPPGDYKIVLSKDGLTSVTLEQRIGLEQGISPRVVMSPSGEATVEVFATPAGADKAVLKSATNYTTEFIAGLPVYRNALSVAYTVPGVVQSVNSSAGSVEIRGALGTGNLVMVDGQNTMDNIYNGQRVGVVFEAIEEIQVITGALPAEYGYVEGGVINQVTKSGGNDFSGSLRFDWANPSWNAFRPMQDRTSVQSSLTTSRSLTVGGPILKDKLWFFAAYYDTNPKYPASYITTGSGFLGDFTPDMGARDYTEEHKDKRSELKLTYSPNADNTITAIYNNSKESFNQSYGAGEAAALTNYAQKGDFWNLSWRSILTSNLVLTTRYGQKTQDFGIDGATAGSYTNGQIISFGNFANYGTGFFDPNDPAPDKRKNETFSAKASLFWDAAGSHETDFGYDYYKGTVQASGYQSGGRIDIPGVANGLNLASIIVGNYDPTTRLFGYDDTFFFLNVRQYVPDKLTTALNGLYVNDKWTVNNHLMFNIGLRYDFYDAKSTAIGKLSSNSSLSPRLGVKYDFFADSKLVAGLSFNRLQGRPLEATLASGTYVNNPIIYQFYSNSTFNGGVSSDFTDAGNAGAARESTWFPISALQTNPLQYFNTAPGTYYRADARTTVKFDPHMKSAQVDEIQATLTYNFKHSLFGQGFVRGTAVQKKWSNLPDGTVGRDGFSLDSFGNETYIKSWTNSSDAERKYKALELDGQLQKGAWFVSANISWSELTGNYVGEGQDTPGSGQTLHNYDIFPAGTVNYDWKTYNPTGRLAGAQSPLAINGLAQYAKDNALGKLTVGLAYRFRSGQHYDQARTYWVGMDVPNMGSNNGAFFTTVNQYENGQRGTGVFASSAYTDLSAQQDFTVSKVQGKPVMAFVKLSVFNAFNRQQQLTWDTYLSDAYTTSDPWTPGNATFGKPTSQYNYGSARSMAISAGIKF